jgi:putative membrane-bound dehydrogenase-like protein
MVLAACSRPGPPYSPREALKTLQAEPGFHAELFAAEPDIVSPVAMEFDENGRLYVVEDPGYPLNVAGKVGRIKLLEDTNGDGRPDRVTIFADQLVMPTGVMRWKKGILVTDAPNVWYFEDTDGDGRADVRRVVLTGFAFSNPQHTVNNPVYGLDNWIYLAHEGPATAVIFPKEFGDPGSDLRFPDRPELPGLKQERRAVRFRPDTYQLEYLAGRTQFGHSFDEWGRYFTVSNEDHLRQEVIAARYLRRNPDLLVSSAMQSISDHGAAADVYPITRGARFEMLSGVGSFTAACAPLFYAGGAWPASFGRFFLVAESAHNLAHRDIVSPAGATFTARRSREGAEFLASTDSWFRPVNFYTGPDGAIYVVDYYHLVIEHPEWMATHTHHSPDLFKGADRGRIYRITPEAGLPLAKGLRLGEASEEQLVTELANPNLWWRRTAQRLLVDRRSPDTAARLVRMFETSPSPYGRLHALWTLDGLGRLEVPLIEKALGDPEPGVRENAVVLAEARLSTSPALAERLLRLESDPDPRVQFQLLATLGAVDTPASRAVQNRLLASHIDDPWMQVAALSAASSRAPELFQHAAAFAAQQTEPRAAFFRQVAAIIGARRKPAEIRRLLETLTRDATWWRAASLEGLAMGLRGRAAGFTSQDLLLKLFADRDDAVRHGSLGVLAVTGLSPGAAPALQKAATTAEDAGAAAALLRADSLSLLALSDPGAHEDLFKKLIDPKQPEPVQAAAVRALGRVKGDGAGQFLLERWRAMTPAVRTEAADAMFVEPGRARLLVAAIRSETVQPWTLAFRHKRQLIMNRDPAIRDSARPLLEEKAGDREKVVERYQAALTRTGDPSRGRQVFERVCAKCHRLGSLGHEVGPDLATIRNRAPQILLPDILIPSRSIAQGYEAYVVETKSGPIIEGVIGPQTPTTITIRHEEGKQDVIRREDIKDMHATNLSAMPEDLDKQVSVDQMADLLSYLKAAW